MTTPGPETDYGKLKATFDFIGVVYVEQTDPDGRPTLETCEDVADIRRESATFYFDPAGKYDGFSGYSQ